MGSIGWWRLSYLPGRAACLVYSLGGNVRAGAPGILTRRVGGALATGMAWRGGAGDTCATGNGKIVDPGQLSNYFYGSSPGFSGTAPPLDDQQHEPAHDGTGTPAVATSSGAAGFPYGS